MKKETYADAGIGLSETPAPFSLNTTNPGENSIAIPKSIVKVRVESIGKKDIKPPWVELEVIPQILIKR